MDLNTPHLQESGTEPSEAAPALHSFVENIESSLQQSGWLGRDLESRFIVAFSGGRDSTALLVALCQLQQKYQTLPGAGRIKITAAYYWHPWRPVQQDLQCIKRTCTSLGIQWVVLTPDLSLPHTEAAAREDRYQQLANLAGSLDAVILTAHHLDDQVETILFRVLRGTGIDGLSGIPAERTLTTKNGKRVQLVRPVLSSSRADIDKFVYEKQIPYVNDPTNDETRYKRNYLRNKILPELESVFPQVRESIARLGEMAKADIGIIEDKLEEVWKQVYLPDAKALDEIRFNQLSNAFQCRVLRKFLTMYGFSAGHTRVNECVDFLNGKARKAVEPGLFSLSKTEFISVYRNRIVLEKPQESKIDAMDIQIPGEVSHRTMRTTLSITPLTQEERLVPVNFKKLPDEIVYVDLSRFEGQQLTFRSREQGDMIRPLGMPASVKLKKYLINRYVPRFKRDQIPLLAQGKNVLWAVGVGLSEEIKVKDKPTHFIKITKG